eukprot:TRINITY_DN2974_c0_g1_i1.p1 TRINITY_DN2974_c0_g1~~TRINITY_DN2974_c0_g1_i1.p1  ORF type:complete len:283 (+),score=30.10 TRINITY_DN2974_c0_g1_i1:41-850(+)
MKASSLTKTFHQYEVSSTRIGKGAFSSVFLVKNKCTGERLAVKKMDLRKYGQEFATEVSILSNLLHDGIVKYPHSEVVRETGYIFLEYLPYPTLYDYVRNTPCGLSEEIASKIFWNIVNTVEAVHDLGFAHRDLKPENLMINPETLKVKLIDFGLSANLTRGALKDDFCGSPLYMSPEELNEEKHNPQIADIWSLGVIYYDMLVGESPWSCAHSLDELIDLVVFSPIVSLPCFLSAGVRELLSGIFDHDPNKRFSLREIKQRLFVLMSR